MAALLGGLEGALAGAALGALSGALVGWGIPKNQALKYEAQVKAGKFLVIARGTPEQIELARRSSPLDAKRAWDVSGRGGLSSRPGPSPRPYCPDASGSNIEGGRPMTKAELAHYRRRLLVLKKRLGAALTELEEEALRPTGGEWPAEPLRRAPPSRRPRDR